MKTNLRNKAINFRRAGKSYSEILQEIPVAKSTLSLWLRSIGLAKQQKQRLTQKRLDASKRGGIAKKKQRVLKMKQIIERAENEVGNLSNHDLWLIGNTLYWAEGSKEKEYHPGSGMIFSNTDPNMINIYLKWLQDSVGVGRSEISFEIYVHESHKNKLEWIREYWARQTGFSEANFDKIYFKRNKFSTKRHNKGNLYFGLIRVRVKKSADLGRKVTGWIQGINSSLGDRLTVGHRSLAPSIGVRIPVPQQTFKLGAKELRKTPPTPETFKTIKRNPIYFVLDNVIDTYNIGSLFRLSDAIAAEKMYICGDAQYPPNSRIHKAAVGTEEWVPWEKSSTTIRIIELLKKRGVQIIAVEQDKRSIPISLLPTKINFPCAVVIGNETDGISKEVLDASDVIVELPMFGVNKSLNVWGTAAVVAYKAIEALIMKPYRRSDYQKTRKTQSF